MPPNPEEKVQDLQEAWDQDVIQLLFYSAQPADRMRMLFFGEARSVAVSPCFTLLQEKEAPRLLEVPPPPRA